jgi:hypothetical protein
VRKRRDVTQTEEKGVWKPPKCYMQHIHPRYDAALQNQQAKACWKCCKTPRKVIGIFCVNTENFQPTKVIDKIYFVTFLKLKYQLKPNGSDCRKVCGKRKRFGV